MKILLVEDDPILGESLTEFLKRNGYEVEWIKDDRKLYENLDLVLGYDVVVLDLILNYGSGEDILKKIREKGFTVPVLILTAKGSIEDKEICFNLGADDYLTKPFNPKELILRIKALARRSYGDRKCVRIGNTEIYPDSMTIKVNGREVNLSKTAWKLLLLLLRHRGKVVPTELILNSVWEDKPVGTEVVRAYIKELRKVLPKDAIKTYKGVGYKLL